MLRRFVRLSAAFACLGIFIAQSQTAGADEFTLRGFDAIEGRAAQKDARAAGLRDGYLAGVRDALRFYTKVSRTFPICWPRDHEIDITLVRNVIAAVRREHPDMAKPDDNYAYLVVLSLYDAYPCR